MAKLEIVQVPVMNDNYVYLAHDAGSGATAAVDPAVVPPVLAVLEEKGWSLSHILNTHHHGDYTGGNLELKDRTGCTIVGCGGDAERIPGIDVRVGEGDSVSVGGAAGKVFEVPGHTSGHIAYWFEESGALFSGDALFAMGCGRLFEGSAAQMWQSLQKLMALPADTRVYCAHEYTQANGRFALSVEPDNADLVARMAAVDQLRRDDQPTVPSTLAEELATNPFLRPDSGDLQRTIGLEGGDPVTVFARTRELKDNF